MGSLSWGEVFAQYGADLMQATWLTVQVAVMSFLMAIVVGVLVVSFRVGPVPPLNTFAKVFVSIFRNTPLLVVFFMFVFGLGEIDIVLEYKTAAVVGLGLYTGAYMAEVLRSGINSVDQGQAEAARAVGMGFTKVLTLIVIPQAWRTVIGPIGNLWIANFKNTSVAATISVVELTALADTLFNNAAVGFLRVLILVAGIYLVFLIPSGLAIRAIESRFAIKR